MLVRLVRVLGPVVGALMEGAASKMTSGPKGSKTKPVAAMDKSARLGAILEADPATVSKVLTELGSRLTEEDLEYFASVFGATTQVEREPGKLLPLTLQDQEIHFAGRFGEMFRWLGFCLEVNYSDFFGNSGPAPGPAHGGPAEGR